MNPLNKVDAAAKWATRTEWAAYGLIGAAAFIGTASVLDAVNSNGEKHEMYKQKRIQERKLKEQSERQLEDRYTGLMDPSANVGLVQGMYQIRSNHSNTWGGVKY